jgi:putative phosphoribosyl transferase
VARNGHTRRFADRREAGQRLAEFLDPLADDQAVVLGLPRGGVVVAAAVASALRIPLDVLVVAKLGVPGRLELGLGAVGEGGVLVLNDRVVASARIAPDQLEEIERTVRGVVDRRAERLRYGGPCVELRDRTAVIVDDGVATGATARAACAVARRLGASRVVVGVPVAPPSAAQLFDDVADDVVILWTPSQFFAVGEFYDDFAPVSEDEVAALLSRSATE